QVFSQLGDADKLGRAVEEVVTKYGAPHLRPTDIQGHVFGDPEWQFDVQVGFVHKGTVLSGQVQSGWLCLSADCSRRLKIYSDKKAFVAIEGRFANRPDLGALLQRVDADTANTASQRPEDSDVGNARSIESLRRRAERACQVLNSEPLHFQVISDKASVRATPDAHATTSGAKSASSRKGHPPSAQI
ncbi:SHE10, partial [Symbiodinium microadriaticum]